MRFLFAIIFFLGSNLLSNIAIACNDQDRSDKTNLDFIYRNNNKHPTSREDEKTIIIFVHGLFGHGNCSFYNSDTKDFWYNLIAKDEQFKGIDIATFFYPTGRNAKHNSIADIARHIRELIDSNVRAYDRIVFIAHSLGGVLVKLALLGDQTLIREKRVDLHLFGVPTKEVKVDEVSKLLLGLFSTDGDAVHVKNLVRKGQADLLHEFINSFWDSVAKEVNVYCYFEGRPLQKEIGGWTPPNHVLVSIKDANSTCKRGKGDHKNSIELADFDHIQMVKPAAVTKDTIYEAFSTNFHKEPFLYNEEAEDGTSRAQDINKRKAILYLDIYPDKTIRKRLFPTSSGAIDIGSGGTPIERGEYIAEIETDRKQKIYKTINVNSDEVIKVIQTRPYATKRGFQICVFGDQPNTEIKIYKAGNRRKVLSSLTLNQENNHKCRTSAHFKKGKYRVVATKSGFKTRVTNVHLNAEQGGVALRFNLKRLDR